MEKEKLELLIKEMKAEIKEELREEILQELNRKIKPTKGENFDFNAYKDQVVADDIRKAEEFIDTNHWYWYIPIIGYFIYMYHMNQALTSIDRGVLRKKINKASLPWLWVDIPFAYFVPIMILFNYWPWRTRAVFRKAIEMTKGNIE
ncbi:hypothetical protein [Mycoplasma todarodis]|uniref:Uncharacterized protein n=1 Tax=Mycoplasma todarodis TaxID=1937191 RepID=A0A4R0XM27_9MOLU|nr:hypothetical protein [Mycoplasma todarodis]TCG11574.1 hypothetical protein C4B25_01170 [Mycoplasma todarodis]